ncbi:polymorphic toxin-type HINT domain-containing protein [Streptomyces sp. GC420]|uniref:polymorphic toxin-type HINT domain-containing protein n=1 Tax=Streptomyces sp. GC420 TaxID=2697568 RepID=UPI001414FD30|nr:polymorphic toxin-type HINT domain-containing protein [Streptomyces sp. GC420]NBM19112.1 hypothetical protein [Streptomyces sp. GC420]
MTPLGDPEAMNPCELDGTAWDSCDVKFKLRYDLKVDFYLCMGSGDGEVTAATCPTESITWLGSETYKNQTAYMTETFTTWDVTKMVDKVFLSLLWDMFVQDFIDCAKGSASGCAWAASNFIPGKKIADAIDGIRALDAAMKTGVGVADALRALKTLDVDPQILATIERQVNVYEDVVAACRVNSFPGATRVLMADGSRKAISEIRQGERLLAADPATGEHRPRPVTHTFRHDADRLVDVTVAGGSLVTSTAGHRFFVVGQGWTVVSDLRAGDRLRTPDGSVRAVTALRDRKGLAPSEVFDLTVGGLHTFFVSTRGDRPQDVLVHNCTNIVADEGVGGAHTLGDHVNPDAATMWNQAQQKGIATGWNDQATAMRAVNAAFEEWIKRGSNVKVLDNWIKKQEERVRKGIGFDPRHDLKELRWQLRNEGSLGTKWEKNGPRAGTPTGNHVVIQLKYVKGHPQKYVVYTSYPE